MGSRNCKTSQQSTCSWADVLATCLILIYALPASLGCQPSEDSLNTIATASEGAKPTALDAAFVSTTTSSEPVQQIDDAAISKFVPNWVADAVFYQIFPERFRNGDRVNDPTRDSLEDPDSIPESWHTSPWTGDWYARSDWERELGDDFYEHGMFQRRYGGDLQGVIDKLDYLQDLGINTIYFNPVFYGKSLHKYDAASMHHIDPHFGPDPKGDLLQMAQETSDPATWEWSAADRLFLDLIQQAHQRDIRVIIDGVFNHTGRDFFAFADLVANQKDSDYRDWYIVEKFDNPDTLQSEFRYKSWWGFLSLPEFANSASQQDLHTGPKRYLFDITRRWMDPNGDGDPADGIDGWRLDVANEVPMGFWRDWNTLVRELNPEAYTVGEFWGDASDQLVQGFFSGTMNYHGFAYLVKGYLVDARLSPHDFGQQLQSRLNDYTPAMQFALQNLVDSHDTDRLASMIVNADQLPYQQAERFDYDLGERVSPRHWADYQVRRPNQRERQIQRLVALMQMTFVGPPMIYYGTESGMWGGDDPCDRMPMVWDDITYEDQTGDPLGRQRDPDSVEFDKELFDYYRSVIQLRRDSLTLSRGTFEVVATDDDANFIAFRRQADDESLLVVINRGEESVEWQLPQQQSGPPRQIFSTTDVSNSIGLQQDGDRFVVTVPALNAVVFAETSAGE